MRQLLIIIKLLNLPSITVATELQTTKLYCSFVIEILSTASSSSSGIYGSHFIAKTQRSTQLDIAIKLGTFLVKHCRKSINH